MQGLHDLGYANGQNIAIDYLSAAANGERFPALAAECVRLKADVIAVSTTPAAQAAMAATRTIPIIMIGLGDPFRSEQTWVLYRNANFMPATKVRGAPA